jgi:hypothetical protein
VALPDPAFEVYEMQPQVALHVRKISKETVARTALGVLALNVLVPGGIGDGWQTGGLRDLNASTRFKCAADAPSEYSAGGCATLWLQSDECAVLDVADIRMTGKSLTAAVAQLQISATARSLSERLYNFIMHVPVWNGSSWMFMSIEASLKVEAVADAQLSQVSLGSERRAEVLVNHKEQTEIVVCARDVDGASINRTGENIIVRIVSADRRANRTEVAQFDAARSVYFVTVTIAQPGEHAVLIETDAEDGRSAAKARIRVACAKGYGQDAGACTEEASKTQMILGGTIGGVFVVVGASGGWLLYKNRAQALRFLVSFFKGEFMLVFKTMTELWDITTDCIVPNRRMPSALLPRSCPHMLARPGYILSGLCLKAGLRSLLVHHVKGNRERRRDRSLHCLPAARSARLGRLYRHERTTAARASPQKAFPSPTQHSARRSTTRVGSSALPA